MKPIVAIGMYSPVLVAIIAEFMGNGYLGRLEPNLISDSSIKLLSGLDILIVSAGLMGSCLLAPHLAPRIGLGLDWVSGHLIALSIVFGAVRWWSVAASEGGDLAYRIGAAFGFGPNGIGMIPVVACVVGIALMYTLRRP